MKKVGGSMAQWLAYSLPDLAAPNSITSTAEIYSEDKFTDIDNVNQQRWLEESDNLDRTHLLVLASGKPVLQK